MYYDFLCPKCGGHLRVGDKIVLTVRKDKWPGGIIFLNTELGNYSVEHHPDFNVEKGEKVEFFCPVCCKDLTSDKHPNLASVIMKNEREYQIYFSKIAGERITFRMMGEHVEIHGEGAGEYVDFFNLSQWT